MSFPDGLDQQCITQRTGLIGRRIFLKRDFCRLELGHRPCKYGLLLESAPMIHPRVHNGQHQCDEACSHGHTSQHLSPSRRRRTPLLIDALRQQASHRSTSNQTAHMRCVVDSLLRESLDQRIDKKYALAGQDIFSDHSWYAVPMAMHRDQQSPEDSEDRARSANSHGMLRCEVQTQCVADQRAPEVNNQELGIPEEAIEHQPGRPKPKHVQRQMHDASVEKGRSQKAPVFALPRDGPS